MGRTYKYLIILTFILNFTNIYSQSDNLISIWYEKAIHTLYLDKQLLESAANALSQYLGPLAPIILENLPYIISFFALFFIFRRFLNIINENLRMKNELSALMAAIATYFFWPFVIPILIVAFIIKVFRVGISKLESLKASLSKINSRLANLFSKTISDIKHFNEDTGKILKEINELDKMTIHPQIKRLIGSIKNNIETSNKIMDHLLKETENENLTLHSLSSFLSQFEGACHRAETEIEQLNRILQNISSDPASLERYGNNIFRPNKFTPKHLNELKTIVHDLRTRLNKAREEGRRVFKDLSTLLTSAENLSMGCEKEIQRELNVVEKDVKQASPFLTSNDKEEIKKEVQNVKRKIINIHNKRLPPLKKLEIIYRTFKPVKKAYISAEHLKKGPSGSPKNNVREAKKIEESLKSALKDGGAPGVNGKHNAN